MPTPISIWNKKHSQYPPDTDDFCAWADEFMTSGETERITMEGDRLCVIRSLIIKLSEEKKEALDNLKEEREAGEEAVKILLNQVEEEKRSLAVAAEELIDEREAGEDLVNQIAWQHRIMNKNKREIRILKKKNHEYFEWVIRNQKEIDRLLLKSEIDALTSESSECEDSD